MAVAVAAAGVTGAGSLHNFDISGGCCSVVVAIKVVLLSCWPVLSEVLLSTLFSTTPFCDNDDDGLLTP